MKINPLFPEIGIVMEMDVISPEAFKAQRLQDLKDLAEYRHRHLMDIQKWSAMHPEERQNFLALREQEQAAARLQVSKEAEAYAKWFDSRPTAHNLKEVMNNTAPKLSWWRQFTKWLQGAY